MDSKWREAVITEYNALIENNTWSLVELPLDRKPIRREWLFKLKKNPDSTVAWYKSRLVGKGFSQVSGHDFGETYSPVVKFSTVNIHIDINNAFLKGDLSEDIYMTQPPGFEQYHYDGKALVCKLHNAIYGLPQAPRNWFYKLQQFLLTIGFTSSEADPSLFILKDGGNISYMIVYVDDILLTGSLHGTIENTDLGSPEYFLGIEVQYIGNGFFINQKKYTLDLLAQTDMMNCQPTTTSMAVDKKLAKDNGNALSDPQHYRSIVGSLQYLCHTRPDISYSVNKVAQYMQNPRDSHWVAVKRILRYLRGYFRSWISVHFW
ncbi:Retrovirus-related Pol polyprotein from transposon TNT 1-94 [Gossypium australe]|uniref:Retrovirus-related Pol polyprotein from transposon TNT 1-94 n=1 Tax=Gossypium australe TaxID=47621 RepID=A0A5B6V151_9ROSI|nr:Retrovirus-related Pol polyprotein from transposon TNT 1-94 [Gossypium australe]